MRKQNRDCCLFAQTPVFIYTMIEGKAQFSKKDVLILLNFFISISAIFVAFPLISNLLNTIYFLLNLIFFSLPKHRSLSKLTAVPTLSPHTFSILNFDPKLDVAYTCATISLALVPTLLNLLNFLPSG